MGIGVRVAGRIAGQRLAAQGQSGAAARNPDASRSPARSPAPWSRTAPPGKRPSKSRQTGRGISRGIGGFLRPFRRVGGILWLEVTGAFFLLFAAVFALRLWQNWAGFSRISRDFTVGAAVVFLYLGVSSFWRARRR